MESLLNINLYLTFSRQKDSPFDSFDNITLFEFNEKGQKQGRKEQKE